MILYTFSIHILVKRINSLTVHFLLRSLFLVHDLSHLFLLTSFVSCKKWIDFESTWCILPCFYTLQFVFTCFLNSLQVPTQPTPWTTFSSSVDVTCLLEKPILFFPRDTAGFLPLLYWSKEMRLIDISLMLSLTKINYSFFHRNYSLKNCSNLEQKL